MKSGLKHLNVTSERGAALVTTMLILLLCSAMLAGFLVTTSSDVRLRSVDRTRTQAFYAAHAGLEKLTADLGDLFRTDFNPDRDNLEDIEAEPPALDGVTFAASDGLGYKILPELGFNSSGAPIADPAGVVTSGPYEGFTGLKTRYDLTATAVMDDGAEARLTRSFFTIAIPIFQFGIFSEMDLSFFAGPTFDFGGRVHTNGNLFLASGSTLNLADKVTAFGEVVRSNLANGWATSSGYTGNVRPVTAPGSYRNLTTSEGSLLNTIGSAQNEPTWTNRSIGTYHGYIRNGRTGAKNLQLPLVSIGGTPIALIQRPVGGEDPLMTGQRMYSQANVRILLSDTAMNITSLPDSSSGTAPLQLNNAAGLGLTAPFLPFATVPTAADPGGVSGYWNRGYRWGPGTPLVDGFLKIEYKAADDSWNDVTLEWLNLGYTQRNTESTDCNAIDPSPNAIIRFQRIKGIATNPVTPPTAANPQGWSNPSTGQAGAAECNAVVGGVTVMQSGDFWPLTLFDAREGKARDNEATGNLNLYTSGVIHYIEFDVNNFRRWLTGAIGVSGANVVNDDGYTVYFSDRRNNRNGAGAETGEYGDEDRINRADANGTPGAGTLDTGEDINDNGTLDVYGQTPVMPAGYSVFAGAAGVAIPANRFTTPFTTAQRPWNLISAVAAAGGNPAIPASLIAKANRPLFFRRALKIVNGASGNLPADGLNITSENPVYVVGPFNATNAAFSATHAPAAVLADALTLLSPGWTDANSFANPYNPTNRSRTTTYYRMAMMAGKPKAFPWAGTNCGAACYQDFGTDGGTHNFIRMLEGNGGTVNYRGSIASLYYSRQATGTYKCCTNVYGAPTRGYAFDVEFLDPNLLPPKTPMFRDTNTTGFQILTRRQQ